MIRIFERAALAAGRAILEIYDAGPSIKLKVDTSPVTEADERAEALILEILSDALPDIPVIAEESVGSGRIPETVGKSFILVDPLDGTKEFINRRSDFTVNIALIKNGVPVAGIVYAPAKSVAYVGSESCAEKVMVSSDFSFFERKPITVRDCKRPPVGVASRSHNSPETEEFLNAHGITEYKSVGSSLKFCLVAEGDADVYPRYGRTMEWDTAAGDAVLRAAGGCTVDLEGNPLAYGKRRQKNESDFANPFFVAWGQREWT
jgi:3'(2'), 5'-bisphosphate nucleotidase